jgi:hypothetical protein
MLTNQQKSQNNADRSVLQIVIRLSGIAVHGLVRCSIKSNCNLVVFPLFYQHEKPAAPSGPAPMSKPFLLKMPLILFLKNFEFVADSLPTDR